MSRFHSLRSNAFALGLSLLATASLAACGHRLTPRQASLVKASIGVTAGELSSSAALERLQTISADLKSTEPTAQRLGVAECTLLQERAQTLGREASAELPLVIHDTDLIDRLSAELQGAVHCQIPAAFDPAKMAKLLGGDASKIESLLQSER
jgi:hypothetical protein